MKRNESVLVYGVAGLLMLILVVAVVFGNDQPDGARTDGQELGNVAKAPDDPVGGPDEGDTDYLSDLLEDVENPAGALGGETAEGTPLVSDEAGSKEFAEPVPSELQKPLERRDAVDPLAILGASRRDGEYRVVKVRPGDSLSVLVQRWCAGLDQLGLAEALNEDVDPKRLKAGQEIYLPWVDDELLAAFHKDRQAESTKVDVARQNTYTLKAGDKLWDLAVAKTGSNRRAPDYIERLMAMNPDLVPERLKIGQKIVMPPIQ